MQINSLPGNDHNGQRRRQPCHSHVKSFDIEGGDVGRGSGGREGERVARERTGATSRRRWSGFNSAGTRGVKSSVVKSRRNYAARSFGQFSSRLSRNIFPRSRARKGQLVRVDERVYLTIMGGAAITPLKKRRWIK